MSEEEGPLWLRRTVAGLEFASAYDRERTSERYGIGSLVRARLYKPRSGKQQRWFWALMRATWKHQSFYPSPEALHDGIKYRLGEVDPILLHTGEVMLRPRSTAYDKMEGGAFRLHIDRVMGVIQGEIIPGLDAQGREELFKEVDALLSTT